MKAVRSSLMYGENRVRKMLGIEELTDPADITYVIPDDTGTDDTDTSAELEALALQTPETAMAVQDADLPDEEQAAEPEEEPDAAVPAQTPAAEPEPAPAADPEQEMVSPATPETAATEG